MKKLLFLTSFSLLISLVSEAQNIEKVKGNRNVIIVQTLIDPFNTIVIDEDFEVEIIYNKEPSVEIETDENLHPFITFDVTDGVLSFNKTAKITSKKRLNIKINYDDTLRNIETKDSGEITSLTTMQLTNASLKTDGSSKVDLIISTDSFTFQGKDRSKVTLNLNADTAKFELGGNTKLSGFVKSTNLTTDLYERSTLNIQGNSDDLLLRADNYSQFNGKDFVVKTCEVICEIASDVYIEVTDSINIEASGTSAIYLYNTPEITITRFTDTVKLQKKTK